MRNFIATTVKEEIAGTKNDIDEAANKIADRIMDKIFDNYRRIDEVHQIVACVRAGIPVQIDYANPGEDELDEYVVKACW